MTRIVKLIALLSIVLSVISCNRTKDKEETDQVSTKETDTLSRLGTWIDLLDQYVYEDDNGVVHVDRICPNLLSGEGERGNKTYAKRVRDTTDLVFNNPWNLRVCSYCVSDDCYFHLLRISERNTKREETF